MQPLRSAAALPCLIRLVSLTRPRSPIRRRRDPHHHRGLLLPTIVENFAPGVDSHQEVLRAYYALTGEYATQLRVMTRQIGGVRYNRATPAQLDGAAP